MEGNDGKHGVHGVGQGDRVCGGFVVLLVYISRQHHKKLCEGTIIIILKKKKKHRTIRVIYQSIYSYGRVADFWFVTRRSTKNKEAIVSNYFPILFISLPCFCLHFPLPRFFPLVL
jgi:hypothetical protein